MAVWAFVSGGLSCPHHSEDGAPLWALAHSYSEAAHSALEVVVAEASGDQPAGPSCNPLRRGRRGRIERKHVAHKGMWPEYTCKVFCLE